MVMLTAYLSFNPFGCGCLGRGRLATTSVDFGLQQTTQNKKEVFIGNLLSPRRKLRSKVRHHERIMTPSTKNELPGLGLPIDSGYDDPRQRGFELAIGRMAWCSDGVTIREQRMLDFIGKITDKPDWEVKVFDEDIVARWRTESDIRPESLDGDVYLSEQMFDFVRCFPHVMFPPTAQLTNT
jgi:hypothetical protein